MSKFGLYINDDKNPDWMRESDRTISVWDNKEEAEKWRKTHTVNPSRYEVRLLSKRKIKEDQEKDNES